MLRSAAVLAAALFFVTVGASNAASQSGALVIRNVADPSLIALGVPGPAAVALRLKVASLKPNYLTEAMAWVPAADIKAATAILKRLASTLADPRGYIGIPYWSARNQKTYDLFDKMEVRGRSALPGGEAIEVLQHMEPFDAFRARYEYRLDGDGLRFTASNLDPIIYSYRKFSAVSPDGMLWAILAYRQEGRVFFYGVGAVKTFDLFGAFRDRLEPSFMGRVKAFFTAMYSNMKE